MVRDTAATRLTLGALLVGAFALASIDAQAGDGSSPLHPVRSAAATVLSPLQSAATTVTDPVVRVAGAVGGANADARRIEELSAQNVALQAQLRDALARGTYTDRSEALADIAAATGTNLTTGHVIALNAIDGYSWTVVIDRGRAHGVVVDSAVLNASGLAGRVLSVTEETATVLLLADPILTVGVRVTDTGQIGSLDGTGGDLLRLKLFNPNARLAVGQDVRTFGSPGGAPYPAGIPIGEIVDIQGAGGPAPVAFVRPYAELSALDVVGVVTGPQETGPQETARQEKR